MSPGDPDSDTRPRGPVMLPMVTIPVRDSMELRVLWSALAQYIDLDRSLELNGAESWNERGRRLFKKLDDVFERYIP